MDRSGEGGAAAVACAENISLLHLLSKFHHYPQRNPPSLNPVEEKERTLQFSRERSLCGAFAFLASIDGNPDFVPAVYIEERTEQRRLEIVVAVNEKSPNNGQEILLDIKHGFEQIFQQLKGLDDPKESRSKVEDGVFEEVVRMCYNRILKRIREEPAARAGRSQGRPTRKRQSIETLLKTLSTYFTQPSNSMAQSQELLTRARDITKSLGRWRRYQDPSMLKCLVEDIFQLSLVDHFEQLVHMIPHTEMAPSSKTSLCNMISKIARYREVSRHIYRTAKKYPIARSADVVTVNLTSFVQGAYGRMGAYERDPKLTTALSRNGITKGPDRVLRNAWSQENDQDVNVVFEKQAKDVLKNAKVHAEVQLIYHYHLKSRHSDLPPRVIRSSKDACYLCNAFIEAEKTFYTSRCHGRLYPSWKIPQVTSRLDLAQRFNELLKGRISSAYSNLAGFKANCPKADPAESTLSTLNWSVSTEVDELSVPTVPSEIDVVIVTTQKETENQEMSQDIEAQNYSVGNKNMIQEESQEGNQDGQQESTSVMNVPDTEGIADKGSQADEPVEISIHVEHEEEEEEERPTPQVQAAEDSKATTVVGQDDEARSTEASPRRRNVSPVQEDRTPRISPAIRISDSTRIQSQIPDRRSEPKRKQRPIRIRTSYAVIRKTYRPEERTPSTKSPVYNIEKTTVYSNDGKIGSKKRTFPPAQESDTILQERMLPARIRIMMNILANV
ncbi:hypothetical protein BDP67DRAFT_531225 [Colletotrichum lupini]|nr:hypothetical protein BDP67DRAFT_531225 [Colletotrichum lupini]